MTEKETIDFLINTSQKESSYLAAFEALGKVIEDLKSEIRRKDFEIAELKREMAQAKGGQ
jgi:hypothetical protein